MPRSVPFDDHLIGSLKDRRLAQAYLNAALEEDDPRGFFSLCGTSHRPAE
jgi:hypothetical protein